MKAHLLRHVSPELRALLSDDERDPRILGDGQSMRVPMSAMDAIPSTKIGNARTIEKLADGLPLQAHRSHWGIPARDSKQELDRLYQARDLELSRAYLNDDYSAQGRGSQPGDLCTVRGKEFSWAFGSPGHLDANLVCVPDSDPRSFDSARRPKPKDAKTIRAEAYDSYESDLVNAWKKGPAEQRYGDAKPRPAARSVVVNDSREKAIADYNHEIENAWRANK